MRKTKKTESPTVCAVGDSAVTINLYCTPGKWTRSSEKIFADEKSKIKPMAKSASTLFAIKIIDSSYHGHVFVVAELSSRWAVVY